MWKAVMLYLLMLLSVAACKKTGVKNDTPGAAAMYFPPLTSTAWETTPLSSLGWKQSGVQALKDYLMQKNTKSFMILVKGRIVMEEYFDGHTAATDWEWNSAGKTLVATTTGIAQQEGLLNINQKAHDYLGRGWTSMPLAKENLITVRHLLTMTAGNDDTKQLVIKPNLTYVADAGTRWAYSNIFQTLTDVVANASNKTFEAYFNEKLKQKIGMDGYWNFGTIFTIYHSTARSMARFGLLALNNGKWNNDQVVNEAFFKESTATSQSINPAYGYMWWLNGKATYMVPSLQTVFPGFLVPTAPADMYAAMGAKDQRIYVVPSKNMVVVRMGNAADPANPNFAVSGFDSELWSKINGVIN
ncbi:MAG: class C beta-lactamase-related serine hydrolase [Bacteroidetes bacterium]|nr:MAG: class C beta-lactamase-related serine hydrolase [Bacteroidota bacterium]